MSDGRGLDVSVPIRVVRTVSAARFAAPPAIDGRLDEPCWTRAGSVTRLFPPYEDTVEGDTRLLFGYDAENLYIAASCSDPAMDKLAAALTERDGAVYGEDCVGLFLQPDRKDMTVYQIYWNALATAFDQKISFDESMTYTTDRAWDGNTRRPARGAATAGPSRCAYRSRPSVSPRSRARCGDSTSGASRRGRWRRRTGRCPSTTIRGRSANSCSSSGPRGGALGTGPRRCRCGGGARRRELRRAAELGLGVVLLERERFPRPKHCAAGLSVRALALLGPAAAKVVHREFRTVELVLGARTTLVWTSGSTVIATTTRLELDAFLAEAAAAAGARLECGAAAESVVVEGSTVRVGAGPRTWRARYLVAADGARGALRGRCSARSVRMSSAAYVRAFPPSGHAGDGPTVTGSPSTSGDAAAATGGFLPKRDHLNVGVYTQRAMAGDLVTDLRAFLAERGLARGGPRARSRSPSPRDPEAWRRPSRTCSSWETTPGSPTR